MKIAIIDLLRFTRVIWQLPALSFSLSGLSQSLLGATVVTPLPIFLSDTPTFNETQRHAYEQQTAPRCEMCLKAVATKGSATTTLLQHVKQRNSAEREQCVALRAAAAWDASPKTAAPKQVMLAASFSHGTPYDKKGSKWKQIMEAVMFYIAKDMVPIYTVEKPGFVSTLRAIEAR